MDWNEFAKIGMALKTAYPNFQIMPSDENKKVWYSMLKDLEYPICQNAIMQIIATSKFPPSIAEIREKYAEMVSLPVADSGQAWEEVMRAIQYYGAIRELEAVASLSEPVRKAVKIIGFRNLCFSENIAVERAQFFRVYETVEKRIKNEAMIPSTVLRQKREYIQAVEQVENKNTIEPPQEEVTEEKETVEITTEYVQNLMYKYGLKTEYHEKE